MKKIGAFTLKPESEDPISTGSIFGKKKEVTTPLTGNIIWSGCFNNSLNCPT